MAAFLVFLIVVYASTLKTTLTVSRVFGAVAIIISLGLCLSAIMWLPTLELYWHVVTEGTIASSSYGRAYTLVQRALSLPMLLTFFIPPVAGSAEGLSLYNALGLYTIDFSAAIGYFPLLIGAWAVIACWRNPSIRPFALLAVCGFLLPIATPLYHFLYHRFFIIAIFGLSGAGAIGLEHILSSERERALLAGWLRTSFYVFVAVAGVILLAGALISFQHARAYAIIEHALLGRLQSAAFADGNPAWAAERIRATLDNYSLTSPRMLITIASIALGYYMLFHMLKRGASDRRLMGVWVVTAIQVGLFAMTWLPMVDTHHYPILPPTKLTDLLQQNNHQRIFVDRRLHTGEQYLFLNNDNAVYRISDIAGFESLLTRSFYIHMPASVTDSSAPSKLLGLLNVKFLITGESSHLPDSEFSLIDSGAVHLWENRAPVQRVWLSFRTSTSTSDSVSISLLGNRSFNPSDVILPSVNGGPVLNEVPDSSAHVRIVFDQAERVILETSALRASYLVLSDTYYPGWEASRDGLPTTVYRANYAMRAVYLPAGNHRVEFSFRPLSFRIGCWISCLTLTLIVGMVLVEIRRMRRAQIVATQPK